MQMVREACLKAMNMHNLLGRKLNDLVAMSVHGIGALSFGAGVPLRNRPTTVCCDAKD
jgi:hypothetical protein